MVSDWSSDVCSSDLEGAEEPAAPRNLLAEEPLGVVAEEEEAGEGVADVPGKKSDQRAHRHRTDLSFAKPGSKARKPDGGESQNVVKKHDEQEQLDAAVLLDHGSQAAGTSAGDHHGDQAMGKPCKASPAGAVFIGDDDQWEHGAKGDGAAVSPSGIELQKSIDEDADGEKNAALRQPQNRFVLIVLHGRIRPLIKFSGKERTPSLPPMESCNKKSCKASLAAEI